METYEPNEPTNLGPSYEIETVDDSDKRTRPSILLLASLSMPFLSIIVPSEESENVRPRTLMRRRLESYGTRSPEVLRERVYAPVVTSPRADAIMQKARSSNERVHRAVARRLSFEEEVKQKVHASQMRVEQGAAAAAARIAEVKQKAKTNNEKVGRAVARRQSFEEEAKGKVQVSQERAMERAAAAAAARIAEVKDRARVHNERAALRVANRLTNEATARASLAQRLAMESAEAELRRFKRMQSIKIRNSQHQARAAKAVAEAKAHALEVEAFIAKAAERNNNNKNSNKGTGSELSGEYLGTQEASKADAPPSLHGTAGGAPLQGAEACAALLAQLQDQRVRNVPWGDGLEAEWGQGAEDGGVGRAEGGPGGGGPGGGGKDFELMTRWMRSIDTINLVRTCLAHLTSTDASAHPEASTRPETSAPPRDKSRLVLALLCMAMDAERIFDCTVRGDKVMKREAKRFEAKLIAALSPSRAVESGESIAASLHRAKRFYAAWSASDKPRTLDQLMASVVATSAHQRQHGMAAAPPEETFAHIRGVGGARLKRAGITSPC